MFLAPNRRRGTQRYFSPPWPPTAPSLDPGSFQAILGFSESPFENNLHSVFLSKEASGRPLAMRNLRWEKTAFFSKRSPLDALAGLASRGALGGLANFKKNGVFSADVVNSTLQELEELFPACFTDH